MSNQQQQPQQQFPFFPCAICREHMNPAENNIVKPLLCAHHFHKTCIIEMCKQYDAQKRNTNCPICRRALYKFILLAKDRRGNKNFKFYNKKGKECKSTYQLKWTACKFCFTTAFNDNMHECTKCHQFWHKFCGPRQINTFTNGRPICDPCLEAHERMLQQNERARLNAIQEAKARREARRKAIPHHPSETRSKSALRRQQEEARRTAPQNNDQNVRKTSGKKRQNAAAQQNPGTQRTSPQNNDPNVRKTSARTRKNAAAPQNPETGRTAPQNNDQNVRKSSRKRQNAAAQQNPQPSTKRARKQ